jgi:hypothetical protein
MSAEYQLVQLGVCSECDHPQPLTASLLLMRVMQARLDSCYDTFADSTVDSVAKSCAAGCIFVAQPIVAPSVGAFKPFVYATAAGNTTGLCINQTVRPDVVPNAKSLHPACDVGSTRQMSR